MKASVATTAVSTALALSLSPAMPSSAGDSTAARASRGKVTLTVPGQLVEGDRFKIVVKVGHAADARQIVLQQAVTDVFGNRVWQVVRKAKVRGRTKHTFRAVAGADDSQRFRARVSYAHHKPETSRPVATTVWHWTDMMDFTAYDYSHGISSNANNHFRMNGIDYRGGWFTSGSYSTWETRFTPGRHCKAFRGIAGLTDDSADGASGAVQLVADETTQVFTSTTLTPGMDQPFQVDLATPYRLFIEAQRTSPAGQAAYPAIANPELLCTGLK